jgi:hypothetical protein
MFNSFFQEYWLFITIVLGVLFLLTLTYVLYTVHLRHKMLKIEQSPKEVPQPKEQEIKISLKDLIKEEFLNQEDPRLVPPPVSIAPSPVLDASANPEKHDIAVAKGSDPAVSSSLPPEPIRENTLSVKPDDTPTSSKPKKELGRYHVLYRKEDKHWYIKREGSDRILRVLPTQREAIAFATIKAITQNTSFVIHQQDGKIRK